MTETVAGRRVVVHVEMGRDGSAATWAFEDAAEAAKAIHTGHGSGLIAKVTRLEFPSVDAEVAYARIILMWGMPWISAPQLDEMLVLVREAVEARASR